MKRDRRILIAWESGHAHESSCGMLARRQLERRAANLNTRGGAAQFRQYRGRSAQPAAKIDHLHSGRRLKQSENMPNVRCIIFRRIKTPETGDVFRAFKVCDWRGIAGRQGAKQVVELGPGVFQVITRFAGPK